MSYEEQEESEMEENGGNSGNEETGDSFDSADPTAALEGIFGENEFADLYASQSEEPVETYCEFLCGSAGTGKSFEIMRRIGEDSTYALLTASTGIAAVNLSATTINSTLGFFDLDSLRDAYIRGSAARKLREVVDEGFRNVVLDEISMVSSQMLDLLVQIFDGVNLQLKENAHPIGLILVGDFAQLPPIPERVTGEAGRARSKPATPWAFEAACWDRFEKNTTRLTKIWRQADLRFLSALNAARRGDGSSCISHLQSSGCEFHTSNDMDFDGTTILAENKHVDAFNSEAMKKVRGRDMFLPTRRWGRDRGEWKNIPSPEIKIRENAYVMLLANQPSGTRGQFNYVNGDCGHVRGIEMRGKGIPPYILVELVRTGGVVKVPPIVRSVSFKDKPTGFVGEQQILGAGEYYPAPHHNKSDKRYVAGQIQYYPIRLGYATTAHKSQGLSLDKVQVDFRAWQFSNPGMGYISLSRCRSLEGLRLVGQPERVAAACVSDPRVARWL
jgi:hypothetical protein